MNTSQLSNYAPAARRGFIAAVSAQAARVGITAKGNAPAEVRGDVLIIGGEAFPAAVASARQKLVDRVQSQGYAATIEAIAYTWFNRLVAIRYMELHGYIDHGYRVLSHPEAHSIKTGRPEILDHAADIDLPDLDRAIAVELKLDGTRDEELYRLLLKAQCNALHRAMPFLFERVDDETELLLPTNLLHTDSLIRQLVESIDEDAWEQIEIIGWLYQFYISEKKDQVIGKVVKSEDIPAATQLFTPNWIVKYMLQNSLGAKWLATYPQSPLEGQMEYYIEPAEQSAEVNAQLAVITPTALNPEELTLIDPASGSGHILVEAYELIKAIYLERGYRQRDVPQLILEKNLFGLDIDERAAQLTGFALMMKGRADDRRLFERGVKLNVMALVDSAGFDAEGLAEGVELSDFGLKPGDLTELKRLFEHATTFGSLIQVPEGLAEKLPWLQQLSEVTSQDLFVSDALKLLGPLVHQAKLLAAQYEAVVANPPYMGGKGFNPLLKSWIKDRYRGFERDLFSAFIVRILRFTKQAGHSGIMTSFVWMFISSHEKLRQKILGDHSISSLVQLHYDAFVDAKAHVCTFVLKKSHVDSYKSSYVRLADFPGVADQAPKTLQAIENRDCGWFFEISQGEFQSIPGSPIAYWVSEQVRESFRTLPPLHSVAPTKQGLATGDNDRFLRQWCEVGLNRTSLLSRDGYDLLSTRWFPCNKGGAFRRWYGNNYFVVNWENFGSEIKSFFGENGKLRSRPQNESYYFKEGLTWSAITSFSLSMRYSSADHMFETKGAMCFPSNDDVLWSVLGFTNSKMVEVLLSATSPTLDFHEGPVGNLPIKVLKDAAKGAEILAQLARSDWDSYERSWDFQSQPLLTVSSAPSLESSYTAWTTQNRDTIAEMKRLEEENNRLFIDAYGLTEELTPDVPIEQITLTVNPAYRYGGKLTEEEQWTRFRQDTMEELVSYAIGCMMGRYSLEMPGLVLANAGDTLTAYDQIKTAWQDKLACSPIDIESVALRERAVVSCFRCGCKLSLADTQFVLARYEEGKLAGRPLLYCEKCTGEMRNGLSKTISLVDFSYLEAIRESWFEPETGVAFIELADCFDSRPTSVTLSEVSFRPDDDGIIPLTDTRWFDDDAAARLVEFISVAWDATHQEDNLTFLAANLSPKKSEASRETLRRYLCNKFFKDHMQTYKKRPIYWLFSSGKQKAFQCLVYLHRYNEGTLARMRSEYVIPLQGKMAARLDKLQGDIQAATSTAHQKRQEKERVKLEKQQVELLAFDEKLRHYADRRIRLDLDDGVKVNYGKFGDLLAEVKAVHGKLPEGL